MEVREMKNEKYKVGMLVSFTWGANGELHAGVIEEKEKPWVWYVNWLSCISKGLSDKEQICGCTGLRVPEEHLIKIANVSRLSDHGKNEVARRFLQKILLMRQLKQKQLLSL